MSYHHSRFAHEFLSPRYELDCVYKDDGRYYILPNGDHVPSVTTVISKQDGDWLKAWKARVGEDKANRISTQAKLRGTAVHLICEKYLLNDPEYRKGSMSINFSTFKSIRPHLDAHVGDIYGIEYNLFSEELRTAGKSDLLCQWKGANSIVDFKTSKYPKEEDAIQSYFVQATCYALMAEEMYNVSIPNITIIIAVDHEETLIFEKDKREYIKKVHQIFKEKR